MKNCVFNHNIITLTLPCSLLFLWRFYYPVLAVNYYHLRVFVKEAVPLISTYIPWKHLGAWGLKFLFFQNNAASGSWGRDPALPQGKGAADGIVSLSTVFSKHSLPANFWGHFSLKVSVLSVSCLFASPTQERQSKESPDKYLMSTATSHAAGCWAALAAGGGAPAVLHPRTVRATLPVGAAATLVGLGLFCEVLQGGGHQPGGARHVLPAPARANRCAEPDLFCRALCWSWPVNTPPRPKYPVIVFCQTPAFLMHLFFSCLVCPRFLEKYLEAFILSLFIVGGGLFF